MRVADVMAAEVEFVPPDSTVQEAATAMAEQELDAILVGTAERLEGILTTRDIILRAVVAGLDPTRARTADVMSSTLFTCGPDDSAAAVRAEMQERQVRRMPVVDAAGRVLGLIDARALEAGAESPSAR